MHGGFSALQRAEIAEMLIRSCEPSNRYRFSALQRAEIAEMNLPSTGWRNRSSFSALQRAEIAEILSAASRQFRPLGVSVLFNEPKLLKFIPKRWGGENARCFSALQRAEIAEIR